MQTDDARAAALAYLNGSDYATTWSLSLELVPAEVDHEHGDAIAADAYFEITAVDLGHPSNVIGMRYSLEHGLEVE